MCANEFGLINRRSFKIWSAVPLRLAVSQITFTSYATSLRNFPLPKFWKFLKKIRPNCENVGFQSRRFSLAGWLRTVQRESVAFRSGEKIHSQSGGASQTGNISGRVFADFEKVSRGLRRALFVGLRKFRFAPSGRIQLLDNFPRALPSAKVVTDPWPVSYRTQIKFRKAKVF